MTEVPKAALSAKTAASANAAALTVRLVTINQVVGYNMAWYRRAAGLTQEELGQRLGGWTKVAVSAAERSWDGKRIRKFDADELVAIARALGVPLPALFLPPANAGTAIIYELEETAGIDRRTQLTELLPYIVPSPGDQTPMMAAFRTRLIALGASYLAEVDLAGVGLHAESLERDALEQHYTALDSLMMQREELERRVDDLRNFEREYRSRLLAYLEGLVSALRRGGDADKRRFVIKKGASGKYHFNLVADNGWIVATSEAYERKEAALNGIRTVINSASGAEIDDQTGE